MTDESTATAGMRAEIDSCRSSHAALLAQLRLLDRVDPTSPSLLPGWSIGHVVTHIARNGDSHLDMLAGRQQYPSVESRNADIDAGAARPWAELLDDIDRVCASVDEAYDAVEDWSGVARMVGGERPRALLPLLRQREVEVHRADLGLGHGFADMPSEYVRRDLRLMEMLWRARRPMGLTPLPDAALAAEPSTRLAWLMGRIELAGLDPAGLF